MEILENCPWLRDFIDSDIEMVRVLQEHIIKAPSLLGMFDGSYSSMRYYLSDTLTGIYNFDESDKLLMLNGGVDEWECYMSLDVQPNNRGVIGNFYAGSGYAGYGFASDFGTYKVYQSIGVTAGTVNDNYVFIRRKDNVIEYSSDRKSWVKLCDVIGVTPTGMGSSDPVRGWGNAGMNTGYPIGATVILLQK